MISWANCCTIFYLKWPDGAVANALMEQHYFRLQQILIGGGGEGKGERGGGKGGIKGGKGGIKGGKGGRR